MTYDEFEAASRRLQLHFPVLADVPSASFVAWYASFAEEKWPLELYKIAVVLVCRQVTQWNRGMNLRGVIAQVEAEARSIYRQKIEERREKNPSRMLEERCNPVDGRREVQKLLASLNQKMEVGR